MFTGIVREVGTVATTDGVAGGIRLELEAPETARLVAIGDSVSVSGVCLTVVAVDGGRVSFDAVPETLRRTSLGRLRTGSAVNVEPALRAGEPLGGHYVQGHVDGVGTVVSVDPEGDGARIAIDTGRRTRPTAHELPELQVVDGRPAYAEIEHLADRLPPTERAAVVLRYGYDLAYDDIATALGSSPEAARQAASSGIRRLRAQTESPPGGTS